MVFRPGLYRRAFGQVQEGKVVAVGGGRRNLQGDVMPLAVKEGDSVLLPEFGGMPLKLEGKE